MAAWSLDDEFVKAVHRALKRLGREQELGQQPLSRLTVVEAQRCQRGWPDTRLGRAAALRQVLTQARQALADQEFESAILLEKRFWQGVSAARLAQTQHVAESTLYARQEQALHVLARTLWRMDQSARVEANSRRWHLARNLPPPSYSRIFGFDEVADRLRAALVDPDGPWLISIEGLGGTGKTTLAHHLATWVADSAYPQPPGDGIMGPRPNFVDVAWETAQQQQFAQWSGIVERPESGPTLTLAPLLSGIARQLGHGGLTRLNLPAKRERLRSLFKENPYLVVVDNLETAADPDQLASELWGLANPTRFLFTSRHSLGDHSNVLCVTLDELSQADSLALIRYEGKKRGIPAVAGASDQVLEQIYALTGGHPLAIKLIVGQARNLPLERALVCLQGASCRRVEELYQFIYKKSWGLLSQAARQVLLAMPALPATGGDWELLLAASKLPERALHSAVQELVSMSLLNVAGGRKRYAIHQLTYTFITSQLIQAWAN